MNRIKIISLILISVFSICFTQPTFVFLKKAYLGNGIWQDSIKIKIDNGIIREITNFDSLPKYGNSLDLSTMTALPGLVLPLKNIDLDSSYSKVKFIEIDKINYNYSKKLKYSQFGICTYLCYSLNGTDQISTLKIYPKLDIPISPIGITINKFSPFELLTIDNRIRNYGEFLINDYADTINVQHFINYKMNNLLLENLFEEMPIYLIINDQKQIENLLQIFSQFHINYIVAYELLSEVSNSSNHLISAILFQDVREYVNYLNQTTSEERDKYIPILKNYSGWNSALITIKKQSDKERFIDAMTNIPAMFFRVNEHYGEIKIGKRANMLFFSSNPFINKKDIVSVMINGKIIIE
ncbi:MAG: hypothetical protein U9R41_08225 [Candidatus Marinimicrobia bacterium]|nr:hypothetical protein [Candidatus Neomarinimicrobiota bacterium]